MKPVHVTSESNPQFKAWKQLLTSKGIKKQGDFILSGEKIIAEKASQKQFHTLIVAEDHWNNNLLKQFPHQRIFILKNTLFNLINPLKTRSLLMVGSAPCFETEKPDQSRLICYCAFSDPGNLGAFARSAKAFGVDKLVLLEECAHPLHPKALKSSSGALLDISIEKGPSILKLNHSHLFALDLNGTPLHKIKKTDLQTPIRLLIGEEGAGIPHSLTVQKITIEHSPDVESLNATVAGSIALWHLNQL